MQKYQREKSAHEKTLAELEVIQKKARRELRSAHDSLVCNIIVLDFFCIVMSGFLNDFNQLTVTTFELLRSILI